GRFFMTNSGRRHRPAIELWWEIESACNLNCSFCYNPWRHRGRPAPSRQRGTEILEQLGRVASEFDCRSLTVSGGEPLLHPDLLTVLSGAQRLGIPTVLSTNGLALTRTLASSLRDCDVSTVQVSLHSHLRSSHNALVGGIDSWDQAVNSLATMRSLGVVSLPTFVATKDNVSHFKDVLEICRMLNLPGAIFNRVVKPDHGFAPGTNCEPASDQAILRALDDADAASEGLQIILGVPLSIPGVDVRRWQSVKDSSCPIRKGQTKWVIGPDLTVRRCSHSMDGLGPLLGSGFDGLLSSLAQDVRDSDSSGNCPRLRQSIAIRPEIRVRTRA
ncbi:MAG TPA: radical SAM protein, partial [Steroidobacteraceae bacterium]|nr:radical SAM protein [Steroidobacteraceae bacterium]